MAPLCWLGRKTSTHTNKTLNNSFTKYGFAQRHIRLHSCGIYISLCMQTFHTLNSRFVLTLTPLNPDTHWLGSTMFDIQYVNMYQKPRSSGNGRGILIYSAWQGVTRPSLYFSCTMIKREEGGGLELIRTVNDQISLCLAIIIVIPYFLQYLSGHPANTQRRYNVAAMSWRCSDIATTLCVCWAAQVLIRLRFRLVILRYWPSDCSQMPRRPKHFHL